MPAIISLLVALTSAFAEEKKPACAALTFDAQEGVTPSVARLLTDRFTVELDKLGLYQLTTSETRKKVLDEQRFERSDHCSASECAVEAGRLLGAQFIIYGSAGKVGSTYTVSVALVNVEHGTVERTAHYDLRGEVDDLLITGMRALAGKLAGADTLGVIAGGPVQQPAETTAALTLPEAVPVDTANPVQGTIQEEGFGKFKLLDRSGTSRLLYLSHDQTAYRPGNWRPSLGDEVLVSYMQKPSRGGMVIQANAIELVKAGPNTLTIRSPTEVEVIESGRTGYRARVAPSGASVKFSRQRSTIVVPVGWVPAPGEKAMVTFTTKPSTGFGMTYLLDRIEKVGSGARSN